VVDGVPVFWQQGPEPLTAGLVFDVGRRDETFAGGGVTHLVEHLVMGSLPKSHLDRNACVSPAATEFFATGRPDAVAGFLRQVCQALSDLPTDRLAHEARVLLAEEERRGGDLVGHLLMVRYGARGLGLQGMVEPALSAITAEQVREHAERWFVRENAALWLTGPPPEGLSLPLGSGPRPTRPEQARLPLALPAQVRYPGPDPAVSFEVDGEDDVVLTGLRVLLDRLTERLRFEGGHSYDVDFDTQAVGGTLTHVTFVADAPPPEVEAVLQGLWSELHRLADEGPTAEELAHDLEGMRERFDDPRSVEGLVGAAAGRHFYGLPVLGAEERLRAREQLTPDDVVAVLRPALATVLVLVPDSAPEVLREVPELPDGTPDRVTGREWRRRLPSDMPRGARLVTAPEGLTLLAHGRQLTVRYDDCVALGVGEVGHAHLEVVGGHALTVPVCEEDWKDGATLVEEVRAALTAVPRYPVRADPQPR
jgi:predicted Zn-dependent peptidase